MDLNQVRKLAGMALVENKEAHIAMFDEVIEARSIDQLIEELLKFRDKYGNLGITTQYPGRDPEFKGLTGIVQNIEHAGSDRKPWMVMF